VCEDELSAGIRVANGDGRRRATYEQG